MAVVVALRERLTRQKQKSKDVGDRVAEAMEIGRYYVWLPLREGRTAHEIIGYDSMAYLRPSSGVEFIDESGGGAGVRLRKSRRSHPRE